MADDDNEHLTPVELPHARCKPSIALLQEQVRVLHVRMEAVLRRLPMKWLIEIQSDEDWK